MRKWWELWGEAEQMGIQTEEKRARTRLSLSVGRCVVCILYSFINYTDFKAALFYNAGLL